MNRKSALILNFTANTYHWGCHGTSSEVYLTLVERGYSVNWISVRLMHQIEPRPTSLRDFDDPAFAARFLKANTDLRCALEESDVVVVNGEGTLHRLHAASVSLLYVMYAARRFLGKPVHLVNHSFFPGGGNEPDDRADALYRGVASALDRVVPREVASAAVLKRLGIAVEQGFDCLPRYIAREPRQSGSSCTGPVVLSGGVTLSPAAAEQVARAAAGATGTDRQLCFLTGAKAFPAAEERVVFASMQRAVPHLRLIEAGTMAEWLATLGTASCLVSARFHHTIAAAFLGTPVIACPGNTPKLAAVCTMMGLASPIPLGGPDFEHTIGARLRVALEGGAPAITGETRERILDLAGNNFAGLP